MPGKAPRQKGDRLECLAVDILRSYGLDAKRVPLSGSMRGFKGDVYCFAGGGWMVLECKSRKSGFSLEYKAIEQGNSGLILKVDRGDPLICVPLRRFAALLAKAEGVKPPEPQSSPSHSLQELENQLPHIQAMSLLGVTNREIPDMDVSENLSCQGGGLGPSPPDVSRET